MNYFLLGGRFRLHYAYVDTHNYLADSIFTKHDLHVKFDEEYRKQGERYVILFCKIKRKYQKIFERAMLELHNKMLICGYNDYQEFCEDIFRSLRNEQA